MAVKALMDWYRANARQLPWRSDPRDPYRVLVSELMLQQTQVERVAPRFEDFVARFPDLAALAESSEEAVLEMWSGLGYYRRARLLHRLARELAENGGELPRTAAELERLPGIGAYTAAAVASLAFGEAVPVLDGNVLRVASRVLAYEENPRSAAGRRVLADWVRRLFAGAPAGEVNEALMELGATLCLPSSPRCGYCPVAGDCRARAAGNPERYPPPRPRRATVELRWVAAICFDLEGNLLVRQVEEGPILRGLWLPPLAELTDGASAVAVAGELVPLALRSAPRPIAAVQHSITHRRIQVLPVLLEAAESGRASATDRWVDPARPGVPTSSLLSKLLEKMGLDAELSTE